MISERLLSEVLGIPIGCIGAIKLDENYIGYEEYLYEDKFDEERTLEYINIHELAHKCKEYFYDDYIFDEACYDIKVTKIEAFTEPKLVYEEYWMGTPYDITELFRACQWILENKDD